MRWERFFVEDSSDWFGRKINRFDRGEDDTISFAAPQGNFNDSPRSEFDIRRIGQHAARFTKLPNWYHLIKHASIITPLKVVVFRNNVVKNT